MREGRSGARHEVDVLAEKRDELATFRVAVECKSWERPIEKDVVAKFAFVLADLGVREGIIVCLGGFRSGAAIAARETGITLWGPDDLARRLGDAAVSELASGGPAHWAPALPAVIDSGRAQQLAARDRRRGLRLRGEAIEGGGSLWLPIVVTQLALSRTEGRRRATTHVRQMWNAYELVDNSLLCSWSSPPTLVESALDGGVIAARHKLTAPARTIAQAVAKHAALTAEPARQRSAARLTDLGIPTGYDVNVESSESAFVPIYLAIAHRRGAERAIAVDMSKAWVDDELGAVLTRSLHWVRQSLEPSTSTFA